VTVAAPSDPTAGQPAPAPGQPTPAASPLGECRPSSVITQDTLNLLQAGD